MPLFMIHKKRASYWTFRKRTRIESSKS